jgi:hypothetical protein
MIEPAEVADVVGVEPEIGGHAGGDELPAAQRTELADRIPLRITMNDWP